jgi:hypothetical protein
MNTRLGLVVWIVVALGLKTAAAEELLVTYSASTVNPVAGEPVSFSGTFEFNTLDGTASGISYSSTGYLINWGYSAPGSGTITENFSDGSTVTLTEAGTFSAHGGSLGSLGPYIRNFGPPTVGLFEPDGYVDYTVPTEAQYLASPDPWAQILLSTYVDADEGYFFNNVYFQDNTGQLEISAVPVPASAWLLLSALGGLGLFARGLAC